MCNVPPRDILCSCGGTIRLTGPDHSQPFFVASDGHEIWGVGESIGCVPPLVGDGIVSGMKSVQILLDHWHDPFEYAKAIKKEFRWMGRERKAVDKLRSNKNLRLAGCMVIEKECWKNGNKGRSQGCCSAYETFKVTSRADLQEHHGPGDIFSKAFS